MASQVLAADRSQSSGRPVTKSLPVVNTGSRYQ